MKNIKIIDGASNCSYDIFAATDEEFFVIFPGQGQHIGFIEDVIERVGDEELKKVFPPISKRPVDKPKVVGIHGTLFYELDWKKKYHPTKKSNEMVVPFPANEG